jgi:hypothetical protein
MLRTQYMSSEGEIEDKNQLENKFGFLIWNDFRGKDDVTE